MKIHPQIFQTNPDVVFQTLEGEAVLLHLKTEEYYTLDETGTRMWQLLIEHSEKEPVIAQMLAEYEVDEATLRNDLTRLIADCKAAGLLAVGGQSLDPP